MAALRDWAETSVRISAEPFSSASHDVGLPCDFSVVSRFIRGKLLHVSLPSIRRWVIGPCRRPKPNLSYVRTVYRLLSLCTLLLMMIDIFSFIINVLRSSIAFIVPSGTTGGELSVEYGRWMVAGVISLVMYPIGIPLFFGATLYNNRAVSDQLPLLMSQSIADTVLSEF